jgi:membrane protease YdiL (CAAX protease family)
VERSTFENAPEVDGSGGGVATTVRRHPLGAFFLLAYLFSWGYWVPIALTGGHRSHFPGLLGPMAAAFVVTAIVGGRPAVGRLVARMFRWTVPIRWYIAGLVPVAVGLLAVAGGALAGDGFPTWESLTTMPGLPEAGWLALVALVFVVNGYGEEVGWRGLAWPRLRHRHTLVRSAGILAGWWAGWHLPVFWLDTGLRGFDPLIIPGWLLGLAAGAIVLGWMYERSGSLLIVALFHTSLNLASATLATEGLPAALTAMAVIVWAIVILRTQHDREPATAADP